MTFIFHYIIKTKQFSSKFSFLGRFHFFTTRNEWKDKTLKNSMLKKTTVGSVLECGMSCLNTPGCLSFNTEYDTTRKERFCELNNKKGAASTSSRKGFQYFEITKAGYWKKVLKRSQRQGRTRNLWSNKFGTLHDLNIRSLYTVITKKVIAPESNKRNHTRQQRTTVFYSLFITADSDMIILVVL